MCFEEAIKIDSVDSWLSVFWREKDYYKRQSPRKEKQELLGLKKLLPCVSERKNVDPSIR